MSTPVDPFPTTVIVLTRAGDHPECLLESHRKLPDGARCKMIDAMLRDDLIAATETDF